MESIRHSKLDLIKSIKFPDNFSLTFGIALGLGASTMLQGASQIFMVILFLLGIFQIIVSTYKEVRYANSVVY